MHWFAGYLGTDTCKNVLFFPKSNGYVIFIFVSSCRVTEWVFLFSHALNLIQVNRKLNLPLKTSQHLLMGLIKT